MNATDACDLAEVMYVDSLFERLPDCRKQFLNNQYRMTNEIGDIISKYFYDSQLKNGRKRSIKGSIQWCDYSPTKEWGTGQGESPYNLDEVVIVKQLLKEEVAKGKNRDIAVITPYRAQKMQLIRNINKDEYNGLNIVIDTVDSFQGKDADAVIFCVTRSTGSLRFFANPRRLNVALSRAKNMCYIVGYSNFAKGNATLKNIYSGIERRVINK